MVGMSKRGFDFSGSGNVHKIKRKSVKVKKLKKNDDNPEEPILKLETAKTECIQVGNANIFVIDDLVQNEEFLENLACELMETIFYQVNSDCSQFMQSAEVSAMKDNRVPILRKLKEAFAKNSDFLELFKNSKTVELDVFSVVFRQFDYWLCHCDSKKAAEKNDCLMEPLYGFMFFPSSEEWLEEYGGALRFYSPLNDAETIASFSKAILPKKNRLIIFPIREDVYYEVSEVISEEKLRVAVHGFWNSQIIPSANQDDDKDAEIPRDTSFNQFSLTNILGNVYKISEEIEKDEIVSEMSESFLELSSISVDDFLDSQSLEKLRNYLNTIESWELVGPSDWRKFQCMPIADLTASADILGFCSTVLSFTRRIISSEILSDDVTSASLRVIRLDKGSYSLLSDHDPLKYSDGLDIWMCLTADDALGLDSWNPEFGGSVHYVDRSTNALEAEDEEDEQVAEDEEEEEEEDEEDLSLVKISPQDNCLSVIYRAESGVQPFIRYLRNDAPSPLFLIQIHIRPPPSPRIVKCEYPTHPTRKK